MAKFTRAFGFFSLGLGLSLLVGYWLKREELRHRQDPTRWEEEEPILVLSQHVLESAAPPVKDDLTLIHGIGQKTAQALTQLGIQTYNQLASAEPQWLLDSLADLRGLNETKIALWIQQAAQLSSEQHD